mgnify:FL=1
MSEVSVFKQLISFSIIILFLGMSASMGIGPEDIEELAEEESSFETRTTSNINWPGSQSGSIYTYDSVDIGRNHVCAVASDNTVRCWGFNNQYQLGNQSSSQSEEVPSPRVVDYVGNFDTEWNMVQGSGTNLSVSIATGSYHSCALETDGSLKCWGDNDFSQLGTSVNNDLDVTFPFPVWDLSDSSEMEVKAIDAGEFHTCAIVDQTSTDNDWTTLAIGRVACWGRNNYGQIGTMSGAGTYQTAQYVVDENYNALEDVTAISSGRNHNCAIVDGNAMCWGDNQYGQVGNATETNSGLTWVQYAVNVTTLLHTQRDVVAIAAGELHTCALLDNGSIGCWGYAGNNEFGDGQGPDSEFFDARYVSLPQGRTAIALEAGDNHNCAILDDNSTWCWGANSDGQLGDGGFGGTIPTQVLTSGYYFTSISAGHRNTCGISNTTKVYCWGDNFYSQVGVGSTSNFDFFAPEQVNLGPSNHNGPDKLPLIHDRDPDYDGIVSIFDNDPYLPDCSPGTYYILGIGCVNTDPGYYQNMSGQDFQIPCPVGTYQPNSGSPTCLDAPPGYYVNSNASNSATPCPPGSQQPLAGQTGCIGIDAGHYTQSGTSNQTPCVPGTYQPQPNQSSCMPSDVGYHVPIEGQTNQTICPTGTYQPGYGRPSCYEASPGHHVPIEGSIEEQECQPGSYADVFGLSDCKLASPGYYVNSIAATSQIECSSGEYQPNSGQTSCLVVDAGHYSNSGSDSMIPCELGYYQGSQASTSCIAADPGYYVDSEGSSMQEICIAGTYSEDSASVECIEADPGYYSLNDGSTGQEICDPGSFSSSGSNSCQLADSGYIVEAAGSSEQIACQLGTFQPSTGSTECIVADPGHYVDVEASSAQIPCSAGTYQPDSGQVNCIPAPLGKFVSIEGATSYSDCEVGTYQSSIGQLSCDEADPGHYVDVEGSDEQIQCNFGTYQLNSGQDDCIDSDPGHFVGSRGSNDQTPCPPGSYQPGSGMSYCNDASQDHYVELEGATEQTECDSGYSQPMRGQTSCIQDETAFPMTIILGVGVVLVAVVGVMIMQYQNKPVEKGIRRPPQGAKRKKKVKGKHKPKQ